MRDTLEFGLKSFFAGCLGCLGAICTVGVAAVIFGFVFKSQIQNFQADITQSFQPVPETLSQGPPDTGSEASKNEEETPKQPAESGEQPSLFVYLTEGDNPDAEKISSFTPQQAKNVSIWVKSPAENAVKFTLELTIPDGTEYPFGEDYFTDPSGAPIICGKLDGPEPPIGKYTLRAFPEGSSTPTGVIQFNITE